MLTTDIGIWFVPQCGIVGSRVLGRSKAGPALTTRLMSFKRHLKIKKKIYC